MSMEPAIFVTFLAGICKMISKDAKNYIVEMGRTGANQNTLFAQQRFMSPQCNCLF